MKYPESCDFEPKTAPEAYLQQELRRITQWHPIATAPMDRPVLVSRDYNNAPIALAKWDGRFWNTWPSSIDFYTSPTHWHELPDNVKQRDA